jgi:ferredoxin
MNIKDSRFLSKASFKALLSALIEDYDVYGTVKKDGFPAFGEIERPSDLVLGQAPTHLSAKGFFFPPKETLLRFDLNDGAADNDTHQAVVEARDQVIIGLNACDIHALNLMDRVFSYGTPDANYLARRSRTVVIGADCMPDCFCFCDSMGTGAVEEGFDLFLYRVKSGFLVRSGSDKGRDLLSGKCRTRKAAAAELKELKRARSRWERSFKTRIDAAPSELPRIYSASDESPVWDRIGAICYGCGSCNNVCPTCYCFDVRDEMKTNLKAGERVRVWDACTLEDFSKVAGGHSFRSSRSARLRHRFNRKFNYLADRFDALFCVGCGRCSRTCLVEINIAKVTNELIRESAKD